MGWIDNLKNISAPSINVSDYTRSDVADNIIDSHKTNTGGWWLNITTIILFIYGIYAFAKKNGLPRAILMSSYCSLMIAVAFILMGYSITIYPFFLFGFIWAVSVIWIYNT